QAAIRRRDAITRNQRNQNRSPSPRSPNPSRNREIPDANGTSGTFKGYRSTGPKTSARLRGKQPSLVLGAGPAILGQALLAPSMVFALRASAFGRALRVSSKRHAIVTGIA